VGALVVTGTSSDAGKSAFVAGLCRWLANQGALVAPFKAQNMSLNSFVTKSGAEIGRAQAAQAQACLIEPEAVMNPVLLKPGSDTGSQLIVLGRAVGEQEAARYWGGMQNALLDVVIDAYRDLAARFDVVICEGAGSPAEINLRQSDIVNMGFARAAGVPAIVVGDIDRGGVFASLVGTLAVLDPADQALIAGFVINKFRGDRELLEPGLARLQQLTGRPTFGVLPFVPDIGVDAEDAIDWALLRSGGPPVGDDVLRVSVVAMPRMSNHTDVDALAVEPGVVVRFVRQAAEISDADLVVLPGTRATVKDLAWLRERGLDQAIARHAAKGKPVLGICGGYQMLGMVIDDPVESHAGRLPGLGLLPVETRFQPDKVLARPSRVLADGTVVHGYEIHHGVVSREGGDPFVAGEGCRAGSVAGTVWHGLLENDEFRRGYLGEVSRRCGRRFAVAPDTSFAVIREARLDRLGDLVADNIDQDQMRRLIDTGGAPVSTLTLALTRPVPAPRSPSAPAPAAAPALPRRTERLVLRPFRHGDEADVLAYRSRDDVVRYMPADPLQPGAAGEFIAERLPATRIAADKDRIVLAVEHEDRVIGEVLIKAGQVADRRAEIGWAFNPEFHGRGLATEAARELLSIAFGDLDMHRVWAQLDPRNAASARLCERLGMRREAYFIQDIWFKGEWSDTAIYALLAADWRAGHAA
jgi:adenosylcobyric acid synthase